VGVSVREGAKDEFFGGMGWQIIRDNLTYGVVYQKFKEQSLKIRWFVK
jgi:hypothetical protein